MNKVTSRFFQLFTVLSQNFEKFQKSDFIKYETDPSGFRLLHVSEFATGRSYCGRANNSVTGLQAHKKTQNAFLAFIKENIPSE